MPRHGAGLALASGAASGVGTAVRDGLGVPSAFGLEDAFPGLPLGAGVAFGV